MSHPFSAFLSNSTSMRRTVRLVAPIFILLVITFFVVRAYKSPDDIIPTTPLRPGSGYQDSNRPAPFKPPVPSVQHNVIRGDNVVWSLENGTTWQSVGRHPNQPECWTFKDRFSAYKSISPETAALISNNNRDENKKAVLLRLGSNQVWRSQFILHARSLVLEAGYLGKYDVIILIHLDLGEKEKAEWLKRIPNEFKPLVQTFSSQNLKDWIPKSSKFKNVYEHNHTPVQMFMDKNPKYDFVYTVENDVRLIGRWDIFLADIDTEYAFHRDHKMEDQTMPTIPDLVTFESIRRPRDQWIWYEDHCVKHFGGLENIRAGLGVVWGWSRRLTSVLTDYNTNGINCYFEYFAPSSAYKANLTTFFYQHPLYCPRASPSDRNSMTLSQLGKNDPTLVQFNKVAVGCTYYFVNKHSQPFWEGWTKNNKVCRPPALIHPVKGDFYN